MKKVVIVGGPGSGKSTFARRLSAITGIPVIHLDYYYNDRSKGYDLPENKPAWRNKVLELMRTDKWIMDGNYSLTFKERGEAADVIFYFNYPLRTMLSGILRRRVEFRNKVRRDMPEGWQERLYLGFIKYVIRFPKDYQKHIKLIINEENRPKIVEFNKRKDANVYLKKLKAEYNKSK